MSSIIAFWNILWNSKTARSIMGGIAAAAFLFGSILWIRDDAADEREEEVQDEHDKNALKQKLEIKESQDEQVKEADDVRRRAEPTDHIPEWMRLKPESD